MRRLAPSLALLVAACAGTPKPAPVAPPTSQPRERGELIGMTIEELGQRFGQPTFQVREGTGLKLQFAGNSCVLDAYLYPSTGGTSAMRVTHIDTRRPSGDDMSQASCLAALAR